MLTSYLQMLLIEAIDNTITVSFQKGGNIWEMSNIFDCKLSELERGVTEIQLQVWDPIKIRPRSYCTKSNILEVTHDGWRNRPCHALLSSFFKRSSQNRRPTWGKSCIDHWLRASFFFPSTTSSFSLLTCSFTLFIDWRGSVNDENSTRPNRPQKLGLLPEWLATFRRRLTN